jgi:excisionase family DNA binding protein
MTVSKESSDHDLARLLLTPREAAKVLGISRSTLYELLGRDLIDSVRIGASRRIIARSLANYIESLRAQEQA